MEQKRRKEICLIGRRLEEKGFISATDGNISAKVAPNKILITPTGRPKGRLLPKELVVVDMKGRVISGGRPSGEIWTHLQAYADRPDVGAVVHAHLPYVTALTVAGFDISLPVLPEVVMTFKKIPVAKFATPASKEGAVAIKGLLKDSEVVVLDRHGALAVGKTLEEAYLKLEKLEHTAKIIAIAKAMGRVKVLSEVQIGKLGKR